MHTVLNLIAIFAAVVLFMRYAVRPAKPNFRVGERLPRRAVCENMVLLGKRCAVTGRGSGIDYRKIKLKKLFKSVKKQVDGGHALPWCIASYNARDKIADSFKKCKRTVGKSYLLGHSGRFPRVYLFCECLVRSTCGNIDGDTFVAAKKAFEQNVALDGREEAALPDFLRFCLIGLFCAAASSALARDAVYERGVRDGEANKADLDYIINAEYSSGLYSSVVDVSALDALLEANGIDKRTMIDERKALSAKSYAVVKSVVRAIDRVDAICGIEVGDRRYTVKRKSFKYLDYALPILIAVYAVFTCIFASPRFSALFFIGSVITYGLLRMPTLISTGGRAAHDIFGDLSSMITNFFKKHVVKKKSSDRRLLYETAYIDEVVPHDNAVAGGAFALDLNGTNPTVDFMFICDGKAVALTEMDSCTLGRGNVYFAVNEKSEICVETVLPTDCNAYCLRITVVNRSIEPQEIKLCAVISGIECDGVSAVKGGIAVRNNDKFVLLACGAKAAYGNNYRDVKYGGEPKFSGEDTHTLIGCKKVAVESLSKSSVVFCLAAGETVRECERVAEFVAERSYFDYIDDCAEAYNGFCRSGEIFSDSFIRYDRDGDKANFSAPNLDCAPCADGETVTDMSVYNGDNAYNVLSDGNITALLDNYGIENITAVNSCVDRVEKKFSPEICVVIGEGDVVWSPTFEPSGNGNMRVVRGFGYTEYICAYNGAVCTLCVFAPKNIGIVFLLKIDNRTDCERDFDIMFSASLDGFFRCARHESSIVVYGSSRSLCISSSERIADHTQYKEGYFSRGKICRATGFGECGNTFAPAVSVKKSVCSKGVESVAFCIANGEKYGIGLIGAERMFSAEKTFFGRPGRYKLDSDDATLNGVHKFALYNAYTRGFVAPCGKPTAAEFYFITCAVKYIDVRAVRLRLIEYMSEFDMCSVATTPVYGLYIASAVSEYVKYSGDVRFLSALLSAKDSRQKHAVTVSVGEYCMRALDAITDTRRLGLAYSPFGVFERKLLIDALHFFPPRAVRRTNGDKYSRLLISAADEYRRGVEYVKNAVFVKPRGVSELLVYARILYSTDDNKNAYIAVKRAAETLSTVGERAENLSVKYAAECAVLYTVITEYTLGMIIRANRVSFTPHIAENLPHLEVVMFGERDIRVVIDGSCSVGNWTIKIGNVTYSSTCIDISRCSERIVLCRDGKIE